MLSAVITAIKKLILIGDIANQANSKLLEAAIKAPSQFPKIKLGVLFLAIFIFFNLYGLNKIENKNYLQLISLRSNISATCSFNSIFLDDLDSESCNSAVIKICKTTPHITNTNFLIQKECFWLISCINHSK